MKNSKQLPFRFLSAYMQLHHLVDISKRPLESEISMLHERCQRPEDAINARKKGVFLARVCKVVRYVVRSFCPVNSIEENAVIRGKLERVLPKLHFRQRAIVRKQYGHLTDKHLRTIQHMEKTLSGLQRRENTLRQKQASYEEKFGNNKMRKQLESLLSALEQAASLSAVNIPGFDESTRILLASDTSGSMC